MGHREPGRDCRDCRHFVDDYRALERALPGLAALSSGLGSSRGEAGVCAVSERFLNPTPACPDFDERQPPPAV